MKGVTNLLVVFDMSMLPLSLVADRLRVRRVYLFDSSERGGCELFKRASTGISAGVVGQITRGVDAIVDGPTAHGLSLSRTSKFHPS